MMASQPICPVVFVRIVVFVQFVCTMTRKYVQTSMTHSVLYPWGYWMLCNKSNFIDTTQHCMAL